jgi:hypothetical protein
MTRHHFGSAPSARVLALLPILAVVAACVSSPVEPSVVGEPLPGSIHLVSDPAKAPYLVTIRLDDVGGPAHVSDKFAPGETIVVDRSTLPGEMWIRVNDRDCEGRFSIDARVQIDMLLHFDGARCTVEALGSHPEGASHVAAPSST